MKKKKRHPQPPRIAEKFLEWYCRPELAEDLQGDLNEYFQRNVKTMGVRRARFTYFLDVLKFLRFYTIRKPEFLNLFTHWIMIGSYIKTSTRGIVRNKLFSAINMIGLAMSMSVGLLMISFLSDLFSYDDFHENGNHIYRVVSTNRFLEEPESRFASTSVLTGKKIREEITGIENLSILRSRFEGDATVGTKAIPVSGMWADDHFYDVFTFPMLSGNPTTALKNPYSIVLTEKTAKKLFGDKDALGQTIRFDTLDYAVTGVMKDPPFFSHLDFEVLVSFSTAEKQNEKEKSFLSWESMWSNYVYVLLPEGANLAGIESNLTMLCDRENKKIQNRHIYLHLQRLDDIVLGPDLSNTIGHSMPKSVTWIIGGLSLIVILSACFNYTNLSLARALRRAREVGTRKVIGAQRSHVLSQFVAEAILISMISLLVAFGLFLFLRPQFLSLAPELAELVKLELTPVLILWFIVFAAAVGLLAGLLPAIFFSKINVIQVLKDVSSVRAFHNLSLRRALIVAQYTLSLIFITTTVIGYRQYKSFLAIDLGFSTNNILNINMQGNNADLMKKELAEMPEVTGISKSLLVTNVGSYYGDYVKYNKPGDSLLVWYNTIDEQFLPLHEHKLLAGRNFLAKEAGGDENDVILNEEALRQLGMDNKNPAKAVGEFLTAQDKKLKIVGVVKDFLYGKADNKLEAVTFRTFKEAKGGYLNVRINSADWQTTLEHIERAWKKIDPIHPISAKFYSDQIAQAYSEFSAMLKVLGFLAVLAVVISSLGLFGMVVFTTETRLKEISIRKVLGASEGKLIYLLSKGFILLLAIAAMISLPATYLFFDQVVLVNFVQHAPIGMLELLAGFLGVALLALLMIGLQTLKVARSNPAMVLKSE